MHEAHEPTNLAFLIKYFPCLSPIQALFGSRTSEKGLSAGTAETFLALSIVMALETDQSDPVRRLI